MARSYITTADYLAATGNPATEDQIRRASLAVDRALIGAIYATDTDGIPTDAGVLAAVKDATLAQVAAVATAEGTRTLKSASIGSASYTYADPIPGGRTLPAGGGLCPDAYAALQVAGVLPAGVDIRG